MTAYETMDDKGPYMPSQVDGAACRQPASESKAGRRGILRVPSLIAFAGKKIITRRAAMHKDDLDVEAEKPHCETVSRIGNVEQCLSCRLFRGIQGDRNAMG